MFCNRVLDKVQSILKPIYDNSIILKNIDRLIGINIFLVIFASVYFQSDSIGYFALLSVLFTVIKLLTKSGEKFDINNAECFLLLYFIFVIISVAGSSLFALSLKGFFKTLTYLSFYISVIHYLKDNKSKIKWIFFAFSLCAFYETIIAFLQNIGAVEEISGWQDMSHLNPEEVMTRVYGTLKPYNPNLFGGYMLSVIPAFFIFPFINKKFILISIACGLLSCTALILTGCRGAYIGLFFELIIFIAILYKYLQPQLKKMFSVVVGFGCLLISFVIVSTASLRARILSIFAMRGDSSNSFRFNVYSSCIQMFKDNWLLGIGCGNQNFREIYGLYMKTGFDALSAYNIYLETAVESGIFALLSLILFLGLNMYKAIKFICNIPASPNKDGSGYELQNRVFVAAALLSIIGILTHGMVDTVFFRPQIQFTFWIMVGIIRVMA